MAEIYKKYMITIGDDDYEAGDTIACVKWKSNDGTEHEISNVTIMDITEDAIIVYPAYKRTESCKDLMITVSNIIE